MACGVLCPLPRRAASLPGEGSTHLRGCGMTAVGAKRSLKIAGEARVAHELLTDNLFELAGAQRG